MRVALNVLFVAQSVAAEPGLCRGAASRAGGSRRGQRPRSGHGPRHAAAACPGHAILQGVPLGVGGQRRLADALGVRGAAVAGPSGRPHPAPWGRYGHPPARSS
jgi:hypothetical protein